MAIADAVKEALGERRGTDQYTEDRQFIAKPTKEIAAERAGFGNPETLRQARSVISNGAPELVAAMDSGKVSISAAATPKKSRAPYTKSIFMSIHY